MSEQKSQEPVNTGSPTPKPKKEVENLLKNNILQQMLT